MVAQWIPGHSELFTLAEPEAEWGWWGSSTALCGPWQRKSSRDGPRMVVPAGHLLATWQRHRHHLPTWNNHWITGKVYSLFPTLSILILFSYTQHFNFFSYIFDPQDLPTVFPNLYFFLNTKNGWDDTYKSVAVIQRVVLGPCACRSTFKLEERDLQLSVSDSRCKCFQKGTSPFALS